MNKIVWKIQHRNFSLDFVCLLLKKPKRAIILHKLPSQIAKDTEKEAEQKSRAEN